MKLSLTFGKRLWLLALLMITGLFISSAAAYLIGHTGADPIAQLRVQSVIMQVLAFLLPALLAAMMSTRLPAELLGIRRAPSAGALLLAIGCLIASIPAMNALVGFFESLPWPETVVEAEKLARRTSESMMSGAGEAQWVVALSVLAIIPGLCEEMFFRGALQSLLRSRPMSAHAAIWLAALAFSLMHAQPIGFIPRMLLGAGFGYAALWSGSVWTAIACHMVNNALVVITYRTGIDSAIAGLSTPVLIVASAALTAAGLWGLKRIYSRFISRGI